MTQCVIQLYLIVWMFSAGNLRSKDSHLSTVYFRLMEVNIVIADRHVLTMLKVCCTLAFRS